jgi:hypothetical protein
MGIFRGVGGTGNSTDDGIVDAVTEQAVIATNKAGEALNSANSASSSASSATTSASSASTSATNAATSATTATTKASEAATSAASAASTYDSFDDRYLGAKSSAPSVDNDGDTLLTGALYFDTTLDTMEVWSGSAWIDAYSSATGVLLSSNNLSDLNNVGTARTNLGLGTAATTDASAYATAAQADQTVSLTGSGATSVSGTYPNFTISSTDNNTTYSVGDGGLTEINFTSADNTKLDGIESGATADQTAAEIKTAYESNADTNAFTDAESTKLSGIEASADVTDTANVTAAGALMDSELTSEASVKALNQGVATTDSPSFVNLTLSGTGSVKVPSGTTAQRDGSPANGMFRYNSTNEQFEGYQSGAWGAIGGGGGSNTFTADTFTGDGSTTAYALSQVVNSEDNLLVFIAGVFQQQSAYSIATASGTTTLTFATAPANTREIIVYSVASAVSGTNLNIDSMTGDGSDTTLSLSINPVNENNTQVFIDGVYQNKDTYSISGTTLTFSTAPPTGSAVEVMTMTQTEINVPVDGTITPAKIASGDFYFDSNLLVGKTSLNTSAVGVEARANGLLAATRDGGQPLLIDRLTNDGDLVLFRKDSANVGSIGTSSSDLTIFSTTSSHVGLQFGNTRLHPTDNAGSTTDGVADLGFSTTRWKDLYLSGGAYLGGTGAANKLDDYEEGTWTPAFSSTFTEGSFNSATGFSSIDGQYTKVGNLVTCIAEFKVTNASGFLANGDNFSITYSSLPFSVLSSSNQMTSFGGTITAYGAVGTGANAGGNFIALNSQSVFVAQFGWVSGNVSASTAPYLVCLQYFTA